VTLVTRVTTIQTDIQLHVCRDVKVM
jgi:hypothetical protein